MSKIFASLRSISAEDLCARRSEIVASFSLRTDLLHGTLTKRFLHCGKKNCRCQTGQKHGPFFYLTRTFSNGKTQSLLLKKGAEAQVRSCLEAFKGMQNALDEICQINFELLRRKKLLTTIP